MEIFPRDLFLKIILLLIFSSHRCLNPLLDNPGVLAYVFTLNFSHLPYLVTLRRKGTIICSLKRTFEIQTSEV